MTSKNGIEDRISGIVQHQIQNKQKQSFNKTFITIFVFFCIATGVYFGYSFFSEETATTTPTGKIILPLPGSKTGNQVRVSGYTKNLAPGSDYVWLVVDKPDRGLCWPKRSRLKPNCSFATYIDENGPNELYLLSLYAVNKSMNNEFVEWFEEERFGGMPMLPKSRRLDTVRLWLGE